MASNSNNTSTNNNFNSLKMKLIQKELVLNQINYELKKQKIIIRRIIKKITKVKEYGCNLQMTESK